ncbi:hypothetical protein JB92DRAFT_2835443 [Gautieria morchelliformis]|nr:hypothetical protein JB92DRAFT_2835443 [Gautieria morchelliformis]
MPDGTSRRDNAPSRLGSISTTGRCDSPQGLTWTHVHVRMLLQMGPCRFTSAYPPPPRRLAYVDAWAGVLPTLPPTPAMRLTYHVWASLNMDTSKGRSHTTSKPTMTYMSYHWVHDRLMREILALGLPEQREQTLAIPQIHGWIFDPSVPIGSLVSIMERLMAKINGHAELTAQGEYEEARGRAGVGLSITRGRRRGALGAEWDGSASGR